MVEESSLMIIVRHTIGFVRTLLLMLRLCLGGTMDTKLQPWVTELLLLITTHGITHT
uniref:Uncharacterized protein n=1 Tax=Arundo donax TaxID=35708 RepID=A0A0A9D6Z8_ARUDO